MLQVGSQGYRGPTPTYVERNVMTTTHAVRNQTSGTTAMRVRLNVVQLRVLVLLVVLGVWWLVAAMALLPATLIPDPILVIVELVKLSITAEFWHAIGATLGGAMLGLLASIVVGIPLGILCGRFWRIERSASFLIDFGRAFPAIALVGVLVLMLGRGVEMKAVLVFVAVLFPLIVQTQHGVQRVEPMVEETCQAFRIPQGLYIRKVLLPAAMPSIMTGLRLAASVAVLVAISAEVLTNAPGIGQKIAEAQIGSNAPKAFAFIVAAGALGYLVNYVVTAIQNSVVRWRPPGVGED